jgi:predicted RNA binding protein YcfA (HicA-like mRNA interferase family)
MQTMKVRQVLKMLKADGWYLDRQRGSHRQFKHSTKPGLITVAGKPSDDLYGDILKDILARLQ